MLSYGLVDALLTELRITEGKSFPASSGASTAASSSSPPPLCTPMSYGSIENNISRAPFTNSSGDDPFYLLRDQYEDVLLVSISPEYELDKEDVEHVFSILGDLKGQVRILSGHRAIVKVQAGQGTAIAAILDGHTLNGIPGSLNVTLIDTKIVTPPATPYTKYLSSFLAPHHKREFAGSPSQKEMPKTLSAATTGGGSGNYPDNSIASGGVCSSPEYYLASTSSASSSVPQMTTPSGGAFQTPPPAMTKRPGRKSSNEVTSQPIRKWTARYEIQVPANNSFQVTRKIIGVRGCNMKNINELTGAKLRLRGRGSGYLEGLNNEECEDPLHLCISSCDKKMFALARAKVDQLLLNIYQQYYQYAIQNNLPSATLYQIRVKEQFRESPVPQAPLAFSTSA